MTGCLFAEAWICWLKAAVELPTLLTDMAFLTFLGPGSKNPTSWIGFLTELWSQSWFLGEPVLLATIKPPGRWCAVQK